MSDFPEEYRDGYVLFFGQKCLVDSRALIPRIETEELVKYVFHILQTDSTVDTIVDIGTGSGVIPYSLVAKCPRELQVIATDISQDALDLAQSNFSHLKNLPKFSPVFLQGDLLKPVIGYFDLGRPDTMIITANLPYVLSREVVGDLLYEPMIAFLGGQKTGFELYERFFRQLHLWKRRPSMCHVVIEFGLWQRDIAETVLMQYPWKCSFFPDLRGIERFCHIIIT